MYEVKLEQFSGPLQLLLDLIEREELPITEVSLSKVADDYLKFVNEHEVPAEELADFLVVAAKLLLIKSQAILPAPPPEESEDGAALSEQLRMYRVFVEAAKRLEALYGRQVMFGREKSAVPATIEFAPPPNVNPHVLRDAFEALLKRLAPFFALERAAIERVVSVQEKIRDIERAILGRARFLFRDLVGGARSRSEVVVSFLALLELMKRRVVRAVQSDVFKDITITHVV